MPIAVLKDGPVPGYEIEIPSATRLLTLHVGGRTVEFERSGNGDGARVPYTAREIVERVQTPKKKAGAKMTPAEAAERRRARRAPSKRVPAVKFTGGSNADRGNET